MKNIRILLYILLFLSKNNNATDKTTQSTTYLTEIAAKKIGTSSKVKKL